jgi:hypothetical protein
MLRLAVIICLAAASAACATAPTPRPLARSIIEPTMVDAAIEIAKQLDAAAETDAPAGEPWFRLVDGGVPILVTAPHATQPTRDGRKRFSDGGGTAALALSLRELTNVWVLHTTHSSPSDPNYYDDNEFKRTLGELIERERPVLLLDIHGSSPMRPYDVDFGTMNGTSLLEQEELLDDLVEYLENEGIDSFSLNRFAASQNDTITKFAANRGVPSIQLEINAGFVTPQEGALHQQQYARLLQGLVRFVQDVAEAACRERVCTQRDGTE